MVNRFDKFAIDIYNWIIIFVASIFVYIIFKFYEGGKDEQPFKDLREKIKRELLGENNV
jgi:Na+/H+ antiporter NhaC